jgi:predicted acetyltransferase
MDNITIRVYQDKDFANIFQILQDCGWMESSAESTAREIIAESKVIVAELGNRVEAASMASAGSLQYQDEIIKANVINAVIVSLIARKAALAAKTLAKLIADEAERGIPFSVLGMFEQGYYNKLGYGTGNYYRQLHFDPSELQFSGSFRMPRRLSVKDYQEVHENRLNRMKLHGYYDMISPIATKCEMELDKKSFGLGYYDNNARLSHHLWIKPVDKENGPFKVMWYACQKPEQFLELLALLKSFNDQVREISITEPPNLQLTDFMKRPIHSKIVTRGSKFQNYIDTYPYWQIRMLDPAYCLQNTHLNCTNTDLNVKITDPLDHYLTKENKWQGCGGEYFLRLGKNSELSKGFRSGLPRLNASIAAFSRMWLGVKPASGLAITDCLAADEKLLKLLDKAFCLPEPQPDWWF